MHLSWHNGHKWNAFSLSMVIQKKQFKLKIGISKMLNEISLDKVKGELIQLKFNLKLFD